MKSNNMLCNYRLQVFAFLLILFSAFSTVTQDSYNKVYAQQNSVPEISQLSETSFRMDSLSEIVITGRNFTNDSLIVFGDQLIKNPTISSTQIRFGLPPQSFAGVKTLSVITRAGIAQQEINITAKPVSELAVGEITTVAGGTFSYGDGQIASKANIAGVETVLFDKAGNIYFADTFGGRVRRIDAQTKVVTTVAGGGKVAEDGQLALLSSIRPRGLALDNTGNLLIADDLTKSIKRVDILTNAINTLAGGIEGPAFGDGDLAIKASLGKLVSDVAVDQNNNIYIATEGRIRRIDAKTGIITTFAGNGEKLFSGDGALATNAGLGEFLKIAVDQKGNLFILSTENNRVRKVDPTTNIITTIAGNGKSPFGSSNPLGDRDGKLATEIPISPFALSLDKDSNLIIIGVGFGKIDFQTGIYNELQTKFVGAKDDGLLISGGIAVDANGNILISSQTALLLRDASTAEGITQIIAGNRRVNSRGTEGQASNASIGLALSAVSDPVGNLFVGDLQNNLIYKIDATTGNLLTVAGSGPKLIFNSGGGDGKVATDSDVSFALTNITVDNSGNIFIVDSLDERVRRVDARTKIITTVAGAFSQRMVADGELATAGSIGAVTDALVDDQGNLLISTGGRIRRVDARTNIITTIAGTGQKGSSGDGGVATKATIFPTALAMDGNKNVFLVNNDRIRRIDAKTNIITTVAGNGETRFSGEGGLATNAGLGFVSNVSIGADGDLFISAVDFDPQSFRTTQRIWRVDSQTNVISNFISGDESIAKGDGGPVSQATLSGFGGRVSADKDGNLLISTFSDASSNVRFVKLSENVRSTMQIVAGSVSYQKQVLTINGRGFDDDTKVTINGKDVTSLMMNKSEDKLDLRGSRKQLNLSKAKNELVITNAVGGSSRISF
ncbi:MAG: IPT/TIG domain-containing protein [Blastocatellia bacterium]|nr:IPT/TIG domain-containing protein [Blastocatellia bacterium]